MSGTPCPRCPAGRLTVVNTKLIGSTRVRYVGCRQCGYRPDGNKIVVSSTAKYSQTATN